MKVVTDNDVVGAMRAIQVLLKSHRWQAYTAELDLEFLSLQDLKLAENTPDRLVWETCQAVGAVLVTGNRAGGDGSLDETIRLLGDASSLPVFTIADPQQVLRESAYAEECAFSLLERIDSIASIRGAGRLYLP